MTPPAIEEKHRKIAARYEALSDFFYATAQALTPFGQMPLINVIMNPFVNGCWGLRHFFGFVANKYDPSFYSRHGKAVRLQSAFNKTSYTIGTIATISGFLCLVPPLLPVALPVFLIATLASNIFETAGVAVNLYRDLKKPDSQKNAGHRWTVMKSASELLYTLGSIVLAALIITAFFTPVGWAAGAGALTFAIAGAAAIMSAFVFAKFCQWKAHKAVQTAHKAALASELGTIELANLKTSPKDTEIQKTQDLDVIKTPKPEPLVFHDLHPHGNTAGNNNQDKNKDKNKNQASEDESGGRREHPR